MIIVHVWLRSKPETRDTTIAALKQMQASTIAGDDGCQHYAFAADLDDDCLFTCMEEWRDEAALAAHLAADHMREPDAILDESTIGKAVIKVYRAEPSTIPDH
ncbi:MAG TPA: antibiotic biosynthesis monooxygenase [Stackebrandtia sp.]|uniref:putative quinol monooxygenase n=1 Tax=Stackebrandtia sp. TaxID=2023065 RepID=UPI002D5BD4E5|nr:antibiotic biosynthesis monooxygenase [Stackebrandtia sp.]HZE38398.1 antibiotic biosynthesis monooxygenase [Stackebrandtia sp.]